MNINHFEVGRSVLKWHTRVEVITQANEGTNDMFRFNGIGTTIYGKREVNPEDGSYIVTKWFTVIYFPIIPLGSYRVIKEKQNFLAGFPKYQMKNAQLSVKQIIFTYLAWWGIPVAWFFLVLIVAVLKPA
jgi:hypothetical protein